MAPLPKPVNISRVFLGWNTPPLPAAAGELVKRYRRAGTLDLSHTVVVVPGKRVGRALRELLVDAAAREGLLLTPPEVVTESNLPERLYSRQKPFASPLVRLLAWTAALRGLEPGLQRILIPHPPHPDDHLRWLRIGEMIGRMHVELAADGHDVDTILRVAETLPGFVDHARWEAIRGSRQAYHNTLHDHGLWDEWHKVKLHCSYPVGVYAELDVAGS
ncbi:MAG TPA: hypothetical protein VHR66_04250 [Gemmataceae bacterium]|jgi:hypothetical protein|nr:hypothetical protein [Gemmataceae bacterium]